MQDYFSISLEDYTVEEISAFCGPKDVYLDLLCDSLNAAFVIRENELRVHTSASCDEALVTLVVRKLFALIEAQKEITERDVIYLCKLAQIGRLQDLDVTRTHAIGRTFQGKSVYPKTLGQRYLCQCMENNDIVFATGVAGTGKTYLAVVYAVSLLNAARSKRSS